MQEKLQLASVWATEGSSNFQISGLSRHNQSSEHNSAYVAYEKQKMATCSSTEIELDCDTPVTVDDSDM